MFLKLYQILHSHNLRQSVCVCLCVLVCDSVGVSIMSLIFAVLHVHLVVFFAMCALYIIDFIFFCFL